MTRLYGWGPVGERVVYPTPFGHWKTTTFVAAFRLDGLFAPLVVDGALTGDLFAAYVGQHLAPQLRPGDLLIMDNLPTHKVKAAAAAVQAVGARVVFLPPYSPDYNPIEQVFSKIKNELRRRNSAPSANWRMPSGSRSTGSHPPTHATTSSIPAIPECRHEESESALVSSRQDG